MAIVRRNSGSGHSYSIDGEAMPGVTTILQMSPKPALINWAGNVTAEYAVDHWVDLAAMAPSTRLKTLQKARFSDRDAGANRGTEVHGLASALAAGEKVEVPEPLAGHVEAYLKFLDKLEPEPVLLEAVIANRSIGYCGTLDAVMDFPDGPLAGRQLLELKTGRSGVYPESALQACAYLNAEVYLDEENTEQDMAALGITGVAVVHCRADGLSIYPVDAGPEVWNYCRHLAWLNRRQENQPYWIKEEAIW